MNTTQTKAAVAHARWTAKTFGLPTETQARRVASGYAALNLLDVQSVFNAMLAEWVRIESRAK